MQESRFPTVYADHSRRWRDNRYVYPVISRRGHGLSIGINLNRDGLCNFDCIYCSVGEAATLKAEPLELDVLRAELEEMLSLAATRLIFRERPFDLTPPELRQLNDVAFSGDGEPTACARFRQACEVVVDVVQRGPLADTKIVLITNASLLRRPCVKESLQFLDQHNGEIWAKLDAGTQHHHELVARTTIPLINILANILDAASARPIVIQSLFMKIHDVRPTEHDVTAYLQQLEDLVKQGARIKLVQVYTVARPTAEAYVAPLERHAINRIVRRVRRLGLNVEGFYGPD
jgi:wyosine [tRNA(Phe)-imidazoG37] synthetase (radical SAM superfamily)